MCEHVGFLLRQSHIVSENLSVAYIIAKLSVDSILDNNQKALIVCSKYQVVHDNNSFIMNTSYIGTD